MEDLALMEDLAPMVMVMVVTPTLLMDQLWVMALMVILMALSIILTFMIITVT